MVFKQGHTPWNKGLTKETDVRVKKYCEKISGSHHSEESVKRLSESMKQFYKNGEKHPNWKGGTSFEPYGPDFNKSCRSKIRIRDNYTCEDCFSKSKEVSVHHIDYDKFNSNQSNLISLCVSCHIKTNGNRDFHQERLEEKQRLRYSYETIMYPILGGVL